MRSRPRAASELGSRWIGVAGALGAALGLAARLSAHTSCYTDACDACSPPAGTEFAASPWIAAEKFPTGAVLPIAYVDPSDGSARRLVATQEGAILLWNGATASFNATPFLDLRDDDGGPGLDKVDFDFAERGLLALAVDPDYASTGAFYVHYTRIGDGDIVVERYQRSANPEVAETTGTTILRVDHPSGGHAAGHNGGHLAFGPEGFLYVSIGDGGGGCDAAGPNGQDTLKLLGKILRLDVRDVGIGASAPECGLDATYEVPADNPFEGAAAGCGEIWALGLRNPFRFSFDRATGDLFIGDVGQSSWEEINFVGALAPPPLNFGWKCAEGCASLTCSAEGCPAGLANPPTCTYGWDADGVNPGTALYYDPILCHSNDPWAAAMAGYRYRGARVPDLAARLLYSDAGCGQFWVSDATFSVADPMAATAACWGNTSGVYGFAEDHLGELYVVRGGAGQIDCVHDGNADGCFWAAFRGLFEDDFEANTLTHWNGGVTQ